MTREEVGESVFSTRSCKYVLYDIYTNIIIVANFGVYELEFDCLCEIKHA